MKIVDATEWGHYKSGIFCADNVGNLNHAVNLVGYGTCPESGEEFWIVRNSWGAGWVYNFLTLLIKINVTKKIILFTGRKWLYSS